MSIDCWACFSCCSDHVPCNRVEKEKLKDKKKLWWKGKEWCWYLDENGKCSIYSDRPLVCKKFGECSNLYMQCPYHPQDTEYSKEFEIRSKGRAREWNLYL